MWPISKVISLNLPSSKHFIPPPKINSKIPDSMFPPVQVTKFPYQCWQERTSFFRCGDFWTHSSLDGRVLWSAWHWWTSSLCLCRDILWCSFLVPSSAVQLGMVLRPRWWRLCYAARFRFLPRRCFPCCFPVAWRDRDLPKVRNRTKATAFDFDSLSSSFFLFLFLEIIFTNRKYEWTYLFCFLKNKAETQGIALYH